MASDSSIKEEIVMRFAEEGAEAMLASAGNAGQETLVNRAISPHLDYARQVSGGGQPRWSEYIGQVGGAVGPFYAIIYILENGFQYIVDGVEASEGGMDGGSGGGRGGLRSRIARSLARRARSRVRSGGRPRSSRRTIRR